MSSPETQTAHNRYRFLADAVAWRYRNQGFVIRWRVRDDLLRDPFYRVAAFSNWLNMGGKVLDIGCGRGIFLGLVASARSIGMSSEGKRNLPISLTGIESDAELAESARQALAGAAEIVCGDMLNIDLPRCQTALLLDVLLYLSPEQQDKLLDRIVTALLPGGLLILREPNAGSTLQAVFIRTGTRFAEKMLGKKDKHAHPRSAQDWIHRLEALGLNVELRSLDSRGWLSKNLLLARKPASP